MSEFFWGDFFSTNEKVVQDAFAKTKLCTLKVLKSASENLGLNISGRTKEPYITGVLAEMSNWIKEFNSIDPSLVIEYKNSIITHFKQGTKPMLAKDFNNPIPKVIKEINEDEILREEIIKWILSTLESGKKTIKKKEFEEHIKKMFPQIAAKTDVQEQLTIVSKKYTSIPSAKRIEMLREELNKTINTESELSKRLQNEFGISSKTDNEAIDIIFSKLKQLTENEKTLVEKLKLLQEQKQEITSQTKETAREITNNVENINISKVKQNVNMLSNIDSSAQENYNTTYLVEQELLENSKNEKLKTIAKKITKDSENVSNAVHNIQLEAKNLSRNLETYNTANKKLRQEFSLQKISNNIENISTVADTLDDFSLDDLDFEIEESSTCNYDNIDSAINDSQIYDMIKCGTGQTCNTDTSACEPSKEDDEQMELSGKVVRLSGSKKTDVMIKIKKLIQKYKISNERQKIFSSQPIDITGLARIQQDMTSNVDSAQYKLQFSRDEAREAFKQALLQ